MLIISINLTGLILTILPNFLPFISINFNFYIIAAFFVINIASETSLMFDVKYAKMALILGSLSKIFAVVFTIALQWEPVFEKKINRISAIKDMLATILLSCYIMVFEFVIRHEFKITKVMDYLIIGIVICNLFLLMKRKPIQLKIRLSIIFIGLAFLTGFLTMLAKPSEITYEIALYDHIYRNMYFIYSSFIAIGFYFYMQSIIDIYNEKTGLLRKAGHDKYKILLDSSNIEGYFSVNPLSMKVKEYTQLADTEFGFKDCSDLLLLKYRKNIDFPTIIEKAVKTKTMQTSKIQVGEKTFLISTVLDQINSEPTVLAHAVDISKEEKIIQDEKKRSKTLEMLVDIANAANKFTTTSQLCKYALKSAKKLINMEFGFVFIFNKETYVMDVCNNYDLDTKQSDSDPIINLNNIKLKKVLLSEKELIVDKDSTDLEYEISELIKSQDLQSLIVQPFQINSSTTGHLLMTSRKNTVVSNNDIKLTKTISTQLGMALDRFLMLDSLQHKYDIVELSNRTKDELITMIGHELKTPLTSIVGYIELLEIENANLNSKQKEFISILHHQSDILSWLVSSINLLALLKTNKYLLEFEVFDLFKALKRLEGRFTKHDIKNDISIICTLKQGILVKTDLSAFLGICTNLLAAFERFSESGSTVILEIIKSGDAMLIEVTDNSLPIGNQDWERIYDVFTTLQTKPSTINKGTVGLPLSIVKEFSMLLGGNTWLHSLPIGNKVVVSIPDAFKLD
jgi:signal transduction histidine kinase